MKIGLECLIGPIIHQCDLLDASFTLVHEVDLNRLPLLYHHLALAQSEICTSERPSISMNPFGSVWMLRLL